MNMTEIVDRLKADAENDLARGKEFLEEHLPVLANTAQAMSTNPLVAAALEVVHLSPDFLAQLATVLRDADAKLGAAKEAQAEADAAAQAALTAAAPPAEPEVPAEGEVAA